MNFGYAPFAHEPVLQLKSEDEINRYPIQLYHYLAAKINLAALDVLEVGSGRGGGAVFIKNYHHPKKMTGVDIAQNAVNIAREYFGCEGVDFVQGSAEHLPFADESFDAVINVESSHAYGSVPRFLAEVTRVLRRGGYFLCADIRTSEAMLRFRKEIHSCGLQVITEENISDNVRRAVELEEPVKQKRIQENIPNWMQEIFAEFAGVRGSKLDINLRDGKLIYYRFVLRKPGR